MKAKFKKWWDGWLGLAFYLIMSGVFLYLLLWLAGDALDAPDPEPKPSPTSTDTVKVSYL